LALALNAAGESDLTNSNGEFSLSVPAGICTLACISLSGYESQFRPLTLAELDTVEENFSLEVAEVPRGRVFGRVLSQRDGSAIAGAKVACGDERSIYHGEGSYEFNIPTGSKVVIVSAGGFETQGQDVQVAANGDHRLDFRLNPAGGVSGEW
jgi:uncharacterized membrane protein